LDHVVAINNGSWEAGPIVLRLSPGQEARFNLKVVNRGDPTNLFLQPSDPLGRAVQINKPNRYVVLEEDIPVLARMPEGRERIDGDILLTSKGGSSKVPISLIRDSEEEEDPEEIGEEMADPDEEQVEYEEEDLETAAPVEDHQESDYEVSPRIRFSRERDVQSYRASSGRREATEYENASEAAPNYQPEWREEPASEPPSRSPQGYSSYQAAPPTEDSYQPEEEYEPETRQAGLFSLSNRDPAQIIPGLMLLAITALLVLTFYAEKIPEFPGALASSILIVTLIIYGAATLLKA